MLGLVRRHSYRKANWWNRAYTDFARYSTSVSCSVLIILSKALLSSSWKNVWFVPILLTYEKRDTFYFCFIYS